MAKWIDEMTVAQANSFMYQALNIGVVDTNAAGGPVYGRVVMITDADIDKIAAKSDIGPPPHWKAAA